MEQAEVQEIYADYSSQNLDRLLSRLTDDVDWPDGPRRLHGKDEVARYWVDQWSRTRTTDRPSRIHELADGALVVRIDQTVRSVDGEVLSTGTLAHVLQTDGDRVGRLDIVPLHPSSTHGDAAAPVRSEAARG